MRLAPAVAAVVALAACAHDDESTRFVESGIALELPTTWSVTGFSTTVVPARLVAASYDVSPVDVEGDCAGRAAILKLPRDGAYVLVIDYGETAPSFDPELPTLGRDNPFGRERLDDLECFGRGYVFRFVLSGRVLQAHVGLGRDADPERRDEAVAVLRSIAVSSRGRRGRGRERAGRCR